MPVLIVFRDFGIRSAILELAARIHPKSKIGTSDVSMLTTEEVLAIHQALATDFAASDDPISPAGVRSLPLVESAIFRQETGHGKKYPTPAENAAALAYGLCKNHGFHNGNKRTSLVALLCHLDANDYTIDESVPHSELYDFMIQVASSTRHADEVVAEMARWIRQRIRKVSRGERIVTYRELRSILASRGLHFANMNGNYVDIVRYEDKRELFGLRKRREEVRIHHMGYPGEGVVVGKNQLKELRKACRLSDEDGVDSQAFYAKLRPADFFVASYRGTLRRLARV